MFSNDVRSGMLEVRRQGTEAAKDGKRYHIFNLSSINANFDLSIK